MKSLLSCKASCSPNASEAPRKGFESFGVMSIMKPQFHSEIALACVQERKLEFFSVNH